MLEQELLDGLRPVTAPGELWAHVRTSRSAGDVSVGWPAGRPVADPEVRRTRFKWVLAAATAVLVVAIAWSFQPRGDGRAAVREWVRSNAGIDLPLAERAGLRVVAAHASRSAANLGFTIEGRAGRLLMTKTAAPSSAHLLPAPDARVYSWSATGLAFTLECASPGDLRAACSLCHG